MIRHVLLLLAPLVLLAQDNKPDFSGIYEWPKALPGADHGKGSATIFDRKSNT